MTARSKESATRRGGLLRWAASLGAVTADALAASEGAARPDSARGRLAAAERAGLVRAWRLLDGEPPLYTLTRVGLLAAGRAELSAGRLSPASAAHAAACCRVAVALERGFPSHRVLGEPEIRSAFAHLCPRLPSARGPRTHRPDLIMLPRSTGELPVAVEVELSVKAPERLVSISRAWARQRSFEAVLYLAAEHVIDPMERAVARARAGERIVVLPIEVLAGRGPHERAGARVLVR